MIDRRFFLAVLAIPLLACSMPVPQQPSPASDKAPDIRGRVTHIEGEHVSVEEIPEEFRGPKAVVKVTDETTIRDGSGKSLRLSDIRVGQTVRVWYTGAVMKSYPLQAKAGEIVVE